MLFTMHATVMIFFVIMPILIGAFGNFLIPLMIGAATWRSRKLNMMSFWFMCRPASSCSSSFFVDGGAAAAGWTSYAPLSAVPAVHRRRTGARTSGCISLFILGVSSMMGSVNYITTIINMRAPGMTLFRMPLTIWALFITAILHAARAAGAHRRRDPAALRPSARLLPAGTADFGSTAAGAAAASRCSGSTCSGSIGHPAVYIMILPAMGMVSDIIADLLPQAALRLRADGLLDRRHRRPRLHRLGPPHVPERHEPDARHRLHDRDDDDRPAVGDQGRSTGSARSGAATSSSRRRCCTPSAFVSMFIIGGLSRHLHGRDAGRHLHPRHLLHRRPHPLRAVRRHRSSASSPASTSGSRRCSAG